MYHFGKGVIYLGKIFKIGCGGLLGLFALLVVIGMIVGGEESAPPNKEKASEKESSQEDIEKNVTIGEDLILNDVAFKVNSINNTQSISAANGYASYTPDAEGAEFLLVNVTVANNGKKMINTDTSFFKLETSDGVTYSPSRILAADEKFFSFDGINPGLNLSGNIVFEVPPNLQGLTLKVQTGYWGTEVGEIKLN